MVDLGFATSLASWLEYDGRSRCETQPLRRAWCVAPVTGGLTASTAGDAARTSRPAQRLRAHYSASANGSAKASSSDGKTLLGRIRKRTGSLAHYVHRVCSSRMLGGGRSDLDLAVSSRILTPRKVLGLVSIIWLRIHAKEAH